MLIAVMRISCAATHTQLLVWKVTDPVQQAADACCADLRICHATLGEQCLPMQVADLAQQAESLSQEVRSLSGRVSRDTALAQAASAAHAEARAAASALQVRVAAEACCVRMHPARQRFIAWMATLPSTCCAPW